MGLAKLDDAEFARRARERNNRVNAAHRQRLLNAGKAQTNVWLSAELRARLESESSAAGVSLSVATEALLLDGLAYRRMTTQTTTTPRASNDATTDLFSPMGDSESRPCEPLARRVLTPNERDERDQQIVELHRQLGNNHEVGRQLGCSEATVRNALKRMKGDD